MAEGYITQFLFKLANQRLAKAHAFSEYGYNAAMQCSFTCVREADLLKHKFINSFELIEYI